MGHGGAREGSGQPPKYPGERKTKPKRIPTSVPNHLIDNWIMMVIVVKNEGYNVDFMSIPEIIETYTKITDK